MTKATPSAQTLAEFCLGHLAENPDLLAAFMSEAGYTPQTLRAALGGDELRHGLIDHFARNESLLLSLCMNKGIDVADFMRLWAKMNPAG